MGPTSVSGTVIIRPGGITSHITDTVAPTIGPTGSIITGRTTIQPVDITIQGTGTGGITRAAITKGIVIGATGTPGIVTGAITVTGSRLALRPVVAAAVLRAME